MSYQGTSVNNSPLIKTQPCMILNHNMCLLLQDHNVAFMETSAKTGLNVDLAFMAVAR